VVDGLVSRRRRTSASLINQLTPRELDVLRAMAEGRTNAAIAETLYLSESAVEKHSTAIFAKLGLADEAKTHRRVAAVLTFLRNP
jgi:DNA-binding NarL/FixJ family response regulator